MNPHNAAKPLSILWHGLLSWRPDDVSILGDNLGNSVTAHRDFVNRNVAVPEAVIADVENSRRGGRCRYLNTDILALHRISGHNDPIALDKLDTLPGSIAAYQIVADIGVGHI